MGDTGGQGAQRREPLHVLELPANRLQLILGVLQPLDKIIPIAQQGGGSWAHECDILAVVDWQWPCGRASRHLSTIGPTRSRMQAASRFLLLRRLLACATQRGLPCLACLMFHVEPPDPRT